MRLSRPFFHGLLVISLLLMYTGGASATTIVIGSASGPETHIPFGFKDFSEDNSAGDIFQQLYLGASFGASPVLIEAVTFFIESGNSHQGTMFYFDQEVYLSTAATSVSSPANTFAANRGADYTQVFMDTYSVGFAGFPINPCSTCTATSLTFTFTPFLYDPTLGDLLIEVTQQGAVSGEDRINFQAGFDSAVSSLRIDGLIFDEVEVHEGYGLRTQFHLAMAPEPSALLLMTALSLGVLWRRRTPRQR